MADSARSGNTNQTDEDTSNPFLAVLPGYPREFFEAIFPRPHLLEDFFAPAGTPAYDWREMQSITSNKPVEQTISQPIAPDAMYVSALAWVAYPYGVPREDEWCPLYESEERISSSETELEVESVSSSEEGDMGGVHRGAGEAGLYGAMRGGREAGMVSPYGWAA